MEYNNNTVLDTYAAYSLHDDERRKSSSGGIFGELAQSTINSNGIVYGVAMSDDLKSAIYIRVDNVKDIDKIRGSKYFQATMGSTFKSVKQDLDNGRLVLFSGTCCQINGLKKFLGNSYDNLLCIDVICHGVPSPKLWAAYVDYNERKQDSKLISVNFRAKETGWSKYEVKEIYDKREVSEVHYNNPYMTMFLRDYCLRPSCYNCVAKTQKMSDITIADFWGIDELLPEMNDDKGISLIIIRTQLGKDAINRIQSNLVIKGANYEDSVRYNPSESKSANMPKKRQMFYNDLDNMEFDELIKKYASTPKNNIIKKIVNKIKGYMYE